MSYVILQKKVFSLIEIPYHLWEEASSQSLRVGLQGA